VPTAREGRRERCKAAMAIGRISSFIESSDPRQLSPFHLKGGGALALPLNRVKARYANRGTKCSDRHRPAQARC
jgi:hypothetical protein